MSIKVATTSIKGRPESMARAYFNKLIMQQVFALAISSCAITAVALEDGELGESSSVNISLTLSVLPIIQIGAVGDIRLDITDRSVDSDYTEYVCIKGNAGDKYSVTATGSSGGSNNFFLQSNTGELLNYHVSFQDPNTTSGGELTPGVPTPHFNLPSLGSDCDGVSASLSVSFKSADLINVEPGLYTGHLTLVVSPQ